MTDQRPLAITGGTGFVGQAVLEQTSAQSLPVRALARREQALRNGVEWLRGDLSNHEMLAQLVSGARAVLHIAGVVNTPEPNGFHEGNVVGTQAVVDAARQAGVQRFIFVSSLSAREPSLSAYGRSKRDAEDVVKESGLDWTIVRPPAIYGPRDKEILELFRAARWGVVPMPPPGRASMIHVDDLARLLLTLSLTESSDRITGGTFEPDDGRSGGWSHRELAKAIGAAVGRPNVWVPHLPRTALLAAARLDGLVRGSRAKLTADRVGYMAHPDWVCSPVKAPPSDLWQPHVPTIQGLAQTAEWYRAQGWL